MYKRYRQGITAVDDVVQRSLSNLSVIDLKHKRVPESIEETDTAEGSSVAGSDHVDPVVFNTVQKCWEQIGCQCVDYGHKARCTRINDDGEWRTVRVFVSSTFTDFFCEREVLVKKVFPELREWCRERMLYLVDCDMRWGVPRDTTTADTIAMCLDELDRCMEETNGEAFFLNMIGERYGWIPAMEDIPVGTRDKFSWVPNTSMTFMEILHGAYRMQNPNAVFMFRDGAILDDIPEQHLSRYRDMDQLQIQHLKQLKTWLLSRFPSQVIEYSCKVEGIIKKYDKEMVNIISLDGFCEEVLQFFKSAIKRTFPNRNSVQLQDSRVLIENANQKKIVEELAGSMLGRKSEAEKIMLFIQGHTSHLKSAETCKPFSRDTEFWHDLGDLDNAPLWLSGQSGYGKSTLLAFITQQAIKGGMDVFYHFCGGTGESHNASLLLQRLAAFLKRDHSTEYLETLYQADDRKLKEIIKEEILAIKRKPLEQPLVLVFEALNQLSSANLVHHLSWLPPGFPDKVRCVLSCTQHAPTVSRVQEHPNYVMKLQALEPADAKEIIQLFLLRFNKILDSAQLTLILESKCAECPLWLYFVCEELRIYGDYRSLTQQVQAVTSSTEGMIEAIIRRLISEDDSNCMEKTLCLISCSFGVITALDLQRMLGNIAEKEPLATLQWTRVRRNLTVFLRVAHYNDQITFVHGNIKEVIYSSLIKNRSDAVRWHTILADYIEYWSGDKVLKVEALPYHLQQACLKKRLVHFVREMPESGHMPSFRRSNIIMECRCRNLADPVIQGVAGAYVCTFCQHSPAVYYPGGFHRNERMCVVCGNHVFNSPSMKVANLCSFHTVNRGVSQGMTRCFLCSKFLGKKMMLPALLCQNCGFGNNGKRCAALDMHL